MKYKIDRNRIVQEHDGIRYDIRLCEVIAKHENTPIEEWLDEYFLAIKEGRNRRLKGDKK